MNSFESYAYAIRSAIEDDATKDKITEDQRKQLTDGIEAILTAVKEKDVAKAETAQKDLEKIFNPIASELYKQADVNAKAAGNADFGQQFQDFMKGQNGGKNDGPTDVNFEEVK